MGLIKGINPYNNDRNNLRLQEPLPPEHFTLAVRDCL